MVVVRVRPQSEADVRGSEDDVIDREMSCTSTIAPKRHGACGEHTVCPEWKVEGCAKNNLQGRYTNRHADGQRDGVWEIKF